MKNTFRCYFSYWTVTETDLWNSSLLGAGLVEKSLNMQVLDSYILNYTSKSNTVSLDSLVL